MLKYGHLIQNCLPQPLRMDRRGLVYATQLTTPFQKPLGMSGGVGFQTPSEFVRKQQSLQLINL